MRGISGALTAAAVLAMAAQADDSSAMLGAGGIVFVKNTPVRMAAEDLYVSPDAVRIRFEFQNPASRDVKTIVAFPLPDINTKEFAESPIGTVTDDPTNFIGFKAVVDGKPVPVKVEQRAFLNGKDVTAEIAAFGAPLNPVSGDGYEKLRQLPKDKRKAMIAAGLADGDDTEIYPQWTLRTRFYWTQIFPAKKTVTIEHSYQPVTGQSFFSAEYQKRTDKYGDIDYCFDQGTWSAIQAQTGKVKNSPGYLGYMISYETAYILSTAGNWQGPIGKFHLTLDKLKPGNILSLCWDGNLKKSGPTAFEFTAENYAPKRDINMIVLENPVPAK